VYVHARAHALYIDLLLFAAVCFSLSFYLVKYIEEEEEEEEEDTRYRNFSLRQLGRYSTGATTTVAAASGTLGTALL